MTPLFQGTYTALITPFDEGGNIDYSALEKLFNIQIDAQIEGIVLLGTTGESPTITPEERTELIRFAIKVISGRSKIIVGTGTNDTAKSIHYSKEAEELGVNGLLVVNPYYNKPTQQGLYEHFTSIADVVHIPVILYNIQGRTGVNLETQTLRRLCRHQNIVAVKEASGNIVQIMDVIEAVPENFGVLSGDDNLTFPLIALGGHGVISVLSNLFPREVKSMVDAALRRDFLLAKKIHYQLLPLMKGCFLETNPIPIKTALAKKGVITEKFRLPLCAMSDEKKKDWFSILEASPF